ncbi:MAG: Asp-tRNA(Asn)/Glu-tRNA(Gln) amidotransferase GatCAB subunit C [Chloroflexota bacterium]
MHVAYLARLGLTEDEVELFREQLSRVLDHFQQLQQLDTAAIPPTAQVTALSNIFDEDEPRPSMAVEDVLLNAPRREENYFRVPAVLEE